MLATLKILLLAARKLFYGELAAVYGVSFEDIAEEMDEYLSVD